MLIKNNNVLKCIDDFISFGGRVRYAASVIISMEMRIGLALGSAATKDVPGDAWRISHAQSLRNDANYV